MGIYTCSRLTSLGVGHQPMTISFGHCQRIGQMPGPEDLEQIPETSLIIVSSSDRRARMDGRAVRGNLYLLDIHATDPTARAITPEQPTDFQPHGLSLHKDDNGLMTVLVINHRLHSEATVERFTLHPDYTLAHEETFRGPELISPNNLQAMGPRQFYFTNDGRSRRTMDRSIDTFLRRPTGSIGYFDGQDFTVPVRNLHFPNGIVAIDDWLFVAETTTGRLRSFRIDESFGTLRPIADQVVQLGMDNLNMDDHGKLLTAAHPNLPALNRHARSSQNRSPVRILQIDVSVLPWTVRILKCTDGKKFSGATAALLIGNQLLAGQAHDNGLLLCVRE